MKKFSLELPKYRLAMHFRLIRRRKPLVAEPIFPTVNLVNRKYRKGTLTGKAIRHISGHKSIGKVMAANFAAFVVASSFIPTVKAADTVASDETVIQIENPLDTQKSIQFPLDRIKINQGYSYFHPGVDFGGDTGDPVRAIRAGEVVEAGYAKGGYGNSVVINHGKGLSSRYAHLSKIEVSVGETVSTQTEIGQVGTSGHSTGSHLHLEVRQNGISLNPLSVISR